MNLEKVDIADVMVIAVLGTALLMAIFYHMNELSMSIASGLLGYIGATAKSSIHQNKNMESDKK